MTASSRFALGRESDDDGSFRRQDSRFRHWVADGRLRSPPRAAATTCTSRGPARGRTARSSARELMGLAGRDLASRSSTRSATSAAGGSAAAATTDPVNGFEFLSQAYEATEPDFDDRVSVPVLWDRERGEIVNNESADILRMLSTAFARAGRAPGRARPPRSARRDRRAQPPHLRERQRRRLQGRLRPPPGRLRARGATAVRQSSTSSTRAWPSAASCSATRRSRPTGACSPRSCASTPSTRSTSSAPLRKLVEYRAPVAVCARPLPVAGRGRTRCPLTRSARTTTAPTR